MIVNAAKYDMHDNAIRRKVFWLLRRLTSYELWRRKRERFANFTVQYEAAVKTPPREETDRVPADNLPIIYEILGLYDKGLRELAQGHRHVWRSGEPFDAAIDRYSHLCQYFYTDPEYWERGAQIKAYPPKVSALARLMRMSEFHGDYASCEVVASSGDVANLQSATFLLAPENYRHRFYELEYPVFPESLPEPPDPPDVVIRSGQTVPFDGIWEPVTTTQTKLLGIVPVGDKTFENNGCFNYLVQGTRAPTLDGPFDPQTFSSSAISTHWRLLWEDTRYNDGVIPDESEYFLDPETVESTTSTNLPAGMEMQTGEICPISGTWEAIGLGVAPIQVLKGQTMPDVLLPSPGSGERRVHWARWRLLAAAVDI